MFRPFRLNPGAPCIHGTFTYMTEPFLVDQYSSTMEHLPGLAHKKRQNKKKTPENFDPRTLGAHPPFLHFPEGKLETENGQAKKGGMFMGLVFLDWLMDSQKHPVKPRSKTLHPGPCHGNITICRKKCMCLK